MNHVHPCLSLAHASEYFILCINDIVANGLKFTYSTFGNDYYQGNESVFIAFIGNDYYMKMKSVSLHKLVLVL